MEFNVEVQDLDDARDLFLLAKERLLDVNEWNGLFSGTTYHFMLTNSKGRKLHRDARVGDMINIATIGASGLTTNLWVKIAKIQYDFFPDIKSESISLLMEAAANPSGTDSASAAKPVETILVKRELHRLTAHCNAGNELPRYDDETPDGHLNTGMDIHPVLSIPQAELRQLLKGFIAVD